MLKRLKGWKLKRPKDWNWKTHRRLNTAGSALLTGIVGAVILLVIVALITFWFGLTGWVAVTVLQYLSDVFGWGWEIPKTYNSYLLFGAGVSLLGSIFGSRK